MLSNCSQALWDDGCPPPRVKNFLADISLRPDAKPIARRPYRLSDFDAARLECRLEEERILGKLVDRGRARPSWSRRSETP